MDQFVKITLVASLIFGVALIVCCFVFIGPITGLIFSLIVGLTIYASIVIMIYYKMGGYLPIGWVISNVIIMSLAAISVFIIAVSWEDFNTFTGWSISYGIITAMIFIYGALATFKDLSNAETEPVYISPWIFPIFKYVAKKHDIEIRNGPVTIVLFSILLALGWSFQCSVWVTPTTTGIAVSCLCEVFFVVLILYLAAFSPVMLGDVKMSLDQLIVKRSWLEAKDDYVKAKSIETPESMITFLEIAEQREAVLSHLTKIRKDSNFAQKGDDYPWNAKGVNPCSIHSLRNYMFELEIEQTGIYLDEVSIIVQFELLMILYSNARLIKDQKTLFKFLEIKKHALAAAEININVPGKGKAKYKYAKVLTQIGRLPAEKQILFKKLREAFAAEENQIEEDQLEKERIEAEKEEERQLRLAEMSEEKKKLLANFDENMPIDEMPDCEMKYKKIIEKYKKDKVLFEDKQFPPNEQSLGAGCTNRGVAKWVRASTVPGTAVYKGKIDPRDVVQGALGDCYFLSAMSVLGDGNVRKCIQFINQDDEDESKSGAYLVRFYKYGEIEDVVIDDFFPVLGNGDFAFCRGGAEGLELWPMILEKAYAKLNGSYNNIEAGKVQYALADMTGGVSEQVELRTVADNKNRFWERIKSLVNQGALMGAGSPENALGDSAISEFGIVQGHAYAVLQFCEFDTYRLISLRNPHGNKGIEWNGDWADDSDMWTQRAKSKCNFNDEADGIFWMDLDDFLENYSYLYICRIMKDWNCQEIEDYWKGESAEGLPSKSNRTAKLEKNPQYEIKITKPAPLFIQMTQFEKINMFKGKQFIMFVVQNIDGRITRMDKNAIICLSGKPVNLNVISNEIQLTTQYSYPLKLTILAANTAHGKEGEGKFELKIYSLSKISMKRI